MSKPEKEKKDLLGDLENIKDLLNVSSSDEPSQDDIASPASDEPPIDIPLLSEIVPSDDHASFQEAPTPSASEPSEKEPPLVTDQSPSAESETQPPAAAPLTNNNPFIPYDAINKLKQERKSMRNFAAEVMEAAQQGVSQTELDKFDLFKYSDSTDRFSSSARNTSSVSEEIENANSQPPLEEAPVAASNLPKPSEQELNRIIDQVIESHRSLLEDALKNALFDFYQTSQNKHEPDH